MEDLKTVIVGLIFLGVFVEGFVEYFVAEPIKSWGIPLTDFAKKYSPRYVAVIISVIVSFGFRVDLPAVFGLSSAWGWLPLAVTALIVSRGSNYISGVVDLVRSITTSLKAKI